MITTRVRAVQSLVLVGALFTQLILLPRPVEAVTPPPDPVVVTVGQPNIWSLEQAHYLLAQIRERNLGIRNPLLSEADLDPNATNANRLDALRTLFEIGASYDQRLGLTNSLNRQNLEFNQQRRQELLTRRAALFDQKNRQLAAISTAQTELNALEDSEANADARKQKEREIASLKEQQKATDEQLKNISAEMELVGGASGQLTSPPAQAGPGSFTDGLTNRLGKTITDDFAKDAARNPRLTASVKLDNYVQMQYELLAKQLTLLRDEVGANERLVFLELPTSIYTTPGRGDSWSAQSSWQVTGYYSQNRFAKSLAALNQQLQDVATQLNDESNNKTPAEILRLRAKYNVQERGINTEIANTKRAFYEDRAEALKHGGVVFTGPEDVGTGLKSIQTSPLFEIGDIADPQEFARLLVAVPATPLTTFVNGQLSATTAALLAPCAVTPSHACRNALANDLNGIILGVNRYAAFAGFPGVQLSPEARMLNATGPSGDAIVRLNRLLLEDAFPKLIAKRRASEARVIDLIPRQSSLNVDDIKEVIHERGAKLVFSFLMGIGGSVNYQQRRERFEQFQQQEVYAAGFGKGEAGFGWNFNPMPGTKRLAPGVRTTYAVMVVPRDATRLQLKANGLPIRPKTLQERIDQPVEATTFDLEIPNGPGDEGFFVTRIDYPLVDVNHRSVVVLRGNFSGQTGVLVNGTPLTRTVGVASPWFGSEKERPFGNAGLGEPDTNVKGFYEVINANQMIMVFLMPKDFKGTPLITLVAPGRARSLNDISLNINGELRQRLREFHDGYMIGAKAKDPGTPLTLSSIEISPIRPAQNGAPQATLPANVLLKIDGLKDGALKVYFNAAEITPKAIGGGLYAATVDLPLNEQRISFSIVKGDEVDTEQRDNPVFAAFTVVQRNYDYVDEEDADDDTVTIVIEGRRIDDLNVEVNEAEYAWQGRSFNRGVLLISGLRGAPSIVRLTDSLTGEALAPIEIYRRKPKPKPKPPAAETPGRRP